MAYDDKTIEGLERDRWQDEEIDRRDAVGVVPEKRPPALGRWPPAAAHIPSDRRLGDLEAELEQLTMNAWGAPQRIRTAHLANERTQLGRDLRSANRVARSPAPTRHSTWRRERVWCSDYPLNGDAIMGSRTTGILWLGAMALAGSAAAQTPPAPPAITRTVVAATKLPTVTDVPLYFRAVSVTLSPGEKSAVSAANGILYQITGSTEVSLGGEAKTLSAGEGLFIAGGKTAALKAGSGGPSTFLHFFIAPAVDLDRPAETAPAVVRELYRTAAPIPDLKPGGYDLNLTRVTFPAQMPSNPPHHRSGAALYFIISGTGANTVDGKTAERGPGSLIYEPYALVHQWGNPGNEPLTFLAFNINPEGVAAVLPGAPAKSQ